MIDLMRFFNTTRVVAIGAMLGIVVFAKLLAIGEGLSHPFEVEHFERNDTDRSDFDRQQDAKEDSKHGDPQVYIDKDQQVHIYQDGGELS